MADFFDNTPVNQTPPANGGDLDDFSSANFDIVANTPLTIPTTLTSIVSVFVYDANGIDITDGLIVTMAGSDVTLEANNNVFSLSLKAIGTI